MKFKSHNKNNKLPPQNQAWISWRQFVTSSSSMSAVCFSQFLHQLAVYHQYQFSFISEPTKWCSKVHCQVVGCGTLYVVGRGSNYSWLFIRSRVGQSVQRLCCGLDSHYSDVAVAWTVSTATVLWAGSHYSDVAVASDCVVGWTVIIAMLVWRRVSTATVLWAGQSL